MPTSVLGLTNKHSRVGDKKEGLTTKSIDQGGAEHRREQIENLKKYTSGRSVRG